MWKITGLDYLEYLSGDYNKKEAVSIMIVALEKSASQFDFDNLIEGQKDNGPTLSGSQLLEALNN
jgi:hypothetical protein